MPSLRAALLIACAGVLTFALVFTLLEVTRSEASPGAAVVAATPTVERSARAVDSFAPKMAAGTIAVGVPIGGSELLLRDVQPGDRVDVLASLPSPGDGRPVTAVVVRGATVLQPASTSEPLLLDVPAPDAMALAHLVLSGTRLGYVIWSANGVGPPDSPPLDEGTVRTLLGLAPAPAQVASPAATASAVPQPSPTPVSVATPTPLPAAAARVGGFLYQVQPGDTWENVARVFSLSVAELKHWNQSAMDTDLAPQTLLFIPTS